jgi:drug/metabolite transporter (DMT)-like permease
VSTRTVAYTTLALVAFASNSLLCRLALGGGTIDAVTFSTIRLISGAAALWLIAASSSKGESRSAFGSWPSAAALFVYAVPFSLAYVSLTAGTGALLLFGSVQLTMLLPGLSAPSLSGGFLMIVAGVSWGIYSLRGRGTRDPLRETTSNFVRSVPLAFVVTLLAWSWFHAELRGVVLAVVSGALTSGVGYVIWYAALRQLTVFRAAVVQLPTPILTAVGGVLLLGESLSVRLIVSTIFVVGGIALALVGRERVVS